MRQQQGSWRALALAGMLAAAAAQAQPQAQAQANDDSTVAPAVKAKQASEIQRGDPARWHQGDPTQQARLRTLQKEIGAAYAEAKKACGESPAAERSACLKDARATWEQDMKNAPSQLETAPQGSVQTTVQTTTPASR
ncbi:hypothetical protein [Massilia aerilata]|uniref:Uncharacterized protein n=1 Tax=Massilia aerilata TaxID=453817 RepID=A0ABW0S3B9_9BURK